MTQQEFLEKIRKDGTINIFDGNISGATETLFYTEPLTITGDVESGIALIVEGDVIVNGSVFDAALTSTGSATIRHAFTGAGKGKVVSGMDVSVSVINGQSIVAKRSIAIAVESLNADLRAYNTIDAHAARIVGGKIEASNEILVHTLGSQDSRQTKVYLGNRKKLLQRINDIAAEEKSLNDRLPKINKCIYRWNRYVVEGIELSADQEGMLAKLKTMRDSFPRQADIFRKEIDQLKTLLKEKIDSSLIVHGTLYENVLIDINGFKEVTDQTLQSIQYYMGIHTLQKAPLKP
jgi:uncharacterized protein (DUF342 family)